MSYVYFIKAQNNTKIGVARNVERRIKQIQNGNPYVLNLITCIKMPSSKSAFDLERYLHAYYGKYRKSGEWFKIPNVRLKKALEGYKGQGGSIVLDVNTKITKLGVAKRQKEKEKRNISQVTTMQKSRLISLLRRNKIQVPDELITEEITVSQLRKI